MAKKFWDYADELPVLEKPDVFHATPKGNPMTELNRRDFLKLVLTSAPTTLVSSRVFETDLLRPVPEIKAISGRGILHLDDDYKAGELIAISDSIFIVLEDSYGGKVPVAMVSTGVSNG